LIDGLAKGEHELVWTDYHCWIVSLIGGLTGEMRWNLDFCPGACATDKEVRVLPAQLVLERVNQRLASHGSYKGRTVVCAVFFDFVTHRKVHRLVQNGRR
jgi:hypothetical protein